MASLIQAQTQSTGGLWRVGGLRLYTLAWYLAVTTCTKHRVTQGCWQTQTATNTRPALFRGVNQLQFQSANWRREQSVTTGLPAGSLGAEGRRNCSRSNPTRPNKTSSCCLGCTICGWIEARSERFLFPHCRFACWINWKYHESFIDLEDERETDLQYCLCFSLIRCASKRLPALPPFKMFIKVRDAPFDPQTRTNTHHFLHHLSVKSESFVVSFLELLSHSYKIRFRIISKHSYQSLIYLNFALE